MKTNDLRTCLISTVFPQSSVFHCSNRKYVLITLSILNIFARKIVGGCVFSVVSDHTPCSLFSFHYRSRSLRIYTIILRVFSVLFFPPMFDIFAMTPKAARYHNNINCININCRCAINVCQELRQRKVGQRSHQ